MVKWSQILTLISSLYVSTFGSVALAEQKTVTLTGDQIKELRLTYEERRPSLNRKKTAISCGKGDYVDYMCLTPQEAVLAGIVPSSGKSNLGCGFYGGRKTFCFELPEDLRNKVLPQLSVPLPEILSVQPTPEPVVPTISPLEEACRKNGGGWDDATNSCFTMKECLLQHGGSIVEGKCVDQIDCAKAMAEGKELIGDQCGEYNPNNKFFKKPKSAVKKTSAAKPSAPLILPVSSLKLPSGEQKWFITLGLGGGVALGSDDFVYSYLSTTGTISYQLTDLFSLGLVAGYSHRFGEQNPTIKLFNLGEQECAPSMSTYSNSPTSKTTSPYIVEEILPDQGIVGFLAEVSWPVSSRLSLGPYAGLNLLLGEGRIIPNSNSNSYDEFESKIHLGVIATVGANGCLELGKQVGLCLSPGVGYNSDVDGVHVSLTINGTYGRKIGKNK